MDEQLTFDGPSEKIPGLRRVGSELLVRWVRLEATTDGVRVAAPPDVAWEQDEDGKVTLLWSP